MPNKLDGKKLVASSTINGGTDVAARTSSATYFEDSPKPTTDTTRAVYNVSTFCAAYNISRSLYYDLRRTNRGPRTMRVGKRKLITLEAAKDWERLMEGGAE